MRTPAEHRDGDAPFQLALDLPPPPLRGSDRLLISDCNRSAAAFAARPEIWPGAVACLVGGDGVGKSRIAAELFAARGAEGTGQFTGHVIGEVVDLASLGHERFSAAGSPAALSPAGAAGRFWFDDLDLALTDASRAHGSASALERALFHLINQVQSGGGALLLSARSAPALWPVALPDLQTRLRAALVLRIDPPDDAALSAHLQHCFEARGLRAAPALTEDILMLSHRSFAGIAAAAETLDRAALREKRAVSRAMATRLLTF